MKSKKTLIGKKIKSHKNGHIAQLANSTRDPGVSTAAECSCGLDKIFPRWTPWLVYVIILTVRISYVTKKSNWWILHPDEIFQSVEVAFSEVYGYGFRFYEHLPPPINVSSSVEEQEAKYGMYSMRSFLFPRFFIAIFHITRTLGITSSPYIIARVAHTSIAALLPLSVYHMTRKLFICKNISLLATILTAFSVHLSVLGSHSLINSFISPFLVYAITPILCHFKDTRLINNHSHDKSESTFNAQYECNGQTKSNTNIKEVDPTKLEQLKEELSGCRNGTAKLPSIMGNPFLQCRTKRVSYTVSGVIIGLCCYVRPDVVVFVGMTVFTFMLIFLHKDTLSMTVTMAIYSFTGFLLGVSLGGLEDWYRFGRMFLSPIQWYNFNFGTNIPAVLFGLSSPTRYLEEVFCPDIFTACLTALTVIGLISILFKSNKSSVGEYDRTIIFGIACSAAIAFVPYASVGHKETRFLHNILVLFLVVTSYSLHSMLCYVNTNFLSKDKSKAAVYFSIGLYIANSYGTFPHPSSESPWVSKSASTSAYVNQCLDFIGSQENVTGVMIDSTLYITAGFSLLRHDVPLLTLVHNEYHEYDGRKTPSSARYIHPMPKRLRIMNRFSDYVYATNIHYLSKFLLLNPKYNYIIISIPLSHTFIDIGYSMIHKAGTHAVLYRNLSQKEAKWSRKKGEQMSLGQNATILEYEGSWLYTAGIYDKAVERMEASLKIDDSRWRPFQLLGLSYIKLQDYKKAKEIEARCFKRHGENVCRSEQKRIILHEEYSNFIIK